MGINAPVPPAQLQEWREAREERVWNRRVSVATLLTLGIPIVGGLLVQAVVLWSTVGNLRASDAAHTADLVTINVQLAKVNTNLEWFLREYTAGKRP